MHKACAESLYERLLLAWKSEQTLDAVFQTCRRGPTFDRTAHGKAIVLKLFQDAWDQFPGAPKPVLFDRMRVLAELLPLVRGDFNLYTQVAANLGDVYLQTRPALLQEHRKGLESAYATMKDAPNPFAPAKGKVKVTAATHPPEVVAAYQHATSFIRAQKFLTDTDFPNISHRITPFGKTPSFSDTDNFCQLPAIGDLYYQPDPKWGVDLTQAFFYMPAPTALAEDSMEDGSIRIPALPDTYNIFKSESGGFMLSQALNVRAFAFRAWESWAAHGAPVAWAVIPRVNSIQVIGPRFVIEAFIEESGAKPFWGVRTETPKQEG